MGRPHSCGSVARSLNVRSLNIGYMKVKTIVFLKYTHINYEKFLRALFVLQGD